MRNSKWHLSMIKETWWHSLFQPLVCNWEWQLQQFHWFIIIFIFIFTQSYTTSWNITYPYDQWLLLLPIHVCADRFNIIRLEKKTCLSFNNPLDSVNTYTVILSLSPLQLSLISSSWLFIGNCVWCFKRWHSDLASKVWSFRYFEIPILCVSLPMYMLGMCRLIWICGGR